jgi:Dyp-type peroxidase family
MPNPTQLQGITDLTVFADIKPGLIDGIFESRSYAWRLERVLELLDAARRGYRESDPLPNPFVDGVARLRGVHFFRFAVLPPVEVVEGTETVRRQKLYLNVTFDGGWEPYLRAIWGQLGTMLDLIFCHCEGYPLAATHSYEEYARWVRGHEAPSQFFYADSGGTAADRLYLDGMERVQRAGGGAQDADLRAAELALANPEPPKPAPRAALAALRSLRGLFGMVQFFGLPAKPQDDGTVLLRFAQDFLPDLRSWFDQGLFEPGRPLAPLLPPERARERDWLMSPHWTRPRVQDHLAYAPELLQAGILEPLKAPAGKFTRGALVLARVTHRGGAHDWLRTGGVIANGGTVALASDKILCTVAITCPGLRALGVHERYLASLPAEFTQGMEGRAGILGDLRMNHPLQWNRPRAGAGAPQLDLSLVDLVIQLRTCEADTEKSDDPGPLLDRLDKWIKTLPSAIQVLAVEPAWSRPSVDGEAASRDHFNYVDGISQPVLAAAAGKHWDNTVKTGELLLGWINDRGDGPGVAADGSAVPASPPWLDLGTFLVIRKIRQYVDRFDGVVTQAAEALEAQSGMALDKAKELVRAKLMGRSSDGTPLVEERLGDNDFNFRNDKAGAQCPFASHVRRANPRAEMAGLRPPRILRRGMSYGPPGSDPRERGVLFMAYNASIAEQFEVIQRWLTGGNSSGVSSSQPDPILGVPRAGEPTVFRFTHGDKVIRVNFGDQAICRLEWGLYAFVPPIAFLKNLDRLMADPGEGPPKTEEPPAEDPAETHKKRIKAEFEDDISRREGWKRVRKRPARVEKIGTSVMVGGYDAVLNVLKDSGRTWSVAGYGERMAHTLGRSPFGQDDDGPKSGHERAFVGAVKAAIAAAVSEKDAYDLSYQYTRKNLAAQLADAKAKGLPGVGVDIVELGAGLIAELCRQWFGIVYDGQVAEAGLVAEKARPVRCPAHFLSVSRQVFSAYPNATVGKRAAAHGPALKEAVAKWVDAAPNAASAPVTQAVLKAIDSAQGIGAEERNGTVANVMLGLPATLLGSWGKVVAGLSLSRRLWRLQHELLLTGSEAHADARKVLYPSLVLAMAANPVADGIWRTAAQAADLQGEKIARGDIVWLGLGAALADKPGDVQAAEDLLFGGTWKTGGDRDTPHACPGRSLAIGALLGALAALLRAGDWAATPSPAVLLLTPLP